MQFEGAVIRQQGVTFAIVIVKPRVLDDRVKAQAIMRSFGPAFPSMPIVLMAQNLSGRATYFGRPDIVRFMSSVPTRRVPWKRYTLN